uniref:protein-serine/threonine phosphatase n=1 Tax=Triticum urartu TaxID=4572 RepID=A0A8R7U2X2_TRIUA
MHHPVPHVKQVMRPNAGGRIIIASDGVCDDLTFEMALECSHGYPSDIYDNRIVNEEILPQGLRDDTTYLHRGGHTTSRNTSSKSSNKVAGENHTQ